MVLVTEYSVTTGETILCDTEFSQGESCPVSRRKSAKASLLGQSGEFAVEPFRDIYVILVAGPRVQLLLKVLRIVVLVTKVSFDKASAFSLPVTRKFELFYVVSKIADLLALFMKHKSLPSYFS
jgi:hypothetical protein